MEGLFVLAVIGAGMVLFLLVMFPIVLVANKAIGATFEREAAATKARLEASGTLRFAEDRVRLRKTSVAPMSIKRGWLWADLRVDDHALYVFQYHVFFTGMVIGQPTIRVVGAGDDTAGPGVRARMGQPPIFAGSDVEISCELGLGSLTLRLSARDPGALMAALQRCTSQPPR